VSRPAELHRRPLAEPDVNLSAHPAPIKQTGQSNGLSVCRTHRSPPVSSCLGHATAWPDPFAPAPLRAFLAPTSRSAPVLRIGTLASRFWPFGLLPSRQNDWFLQFHVTACIRFSPPLRRSPSAQSSGTPRTCPRRTRRSWFRRLLSFLTTRLRRVHSRSSLGCSPARV